MRLVFLTEFDDRVDVERADRAQVDDLGLDAVLRQRLGGLQRLATMSEKATIVTWLPGRTIRALPIGTMKSGSSGTGTRWPYSSSFSRKMTGFGSRIADLSRPFASAADHGRDDLEAGHMRVPAGIALRVLRRDARGDAVGAAEDDRAAHLAARHVAASWPPS